jgi:hypothetical protein
LGRELNVQQVLQRALRALDLRAQAGLLAHVHGDEQVRVRDGSDDAVEPAERKICPR